jgi:hypothetical protein
VFPVRYGLGLYIPEAWTTTVRYVDSFTFLYVDDVRTSQEAWTTTVRYVDSINFLYVDDVRTS